MCADQSYQMYDISSEEEDSNVDGHSDSDSETPTMLPEEVTDRRAYVSKMANLFKNMFEEKPVNKGCEKKPVKKGWEKKKYVRTGKLFLIFLMQKL